MTVRSFVPATGLGTFLPLYDRLFATFMPEHRLRRHLVEQCQLAPGQRALDVGCGTGTLVGLLAAENPEAKLFGVDIDPRILQIARRKHAASLFEGVHWQVGSATRLNCEDSSMDCVASSLVFHHLTPNEKTDALREMHRVLVAGGKLLLADFAAPTNIMQRMQFFPVRMLDGWERTACNVGGKLPELIRAVGFDTATETLTCNSTLGTVRSYRAIKP